jgi:hypothetical protein
MCGGPDARETRPEQRLICGDHWATKVSLQRFDDADGTKTVAPITTTSAFSGVLAIHFAPIHPLAGRTCWLRWKTLPGSYVAFTSARRPYRPDRCNAAMSKAHMRSRGGSSCTAWRSWMRTS